MSHFNHEDESKDIRNDARGMLQRKVGLARLLLIGLFPGPGTVTYYLVVQFIEIRTLPTKICMIKEFIHCEPPGHSVSLLVYLFCVTNNKGFTPFYTVDSPTVLLDH